MVWGVGTNSGMDYWNETLDWTELFSFFGQVSELILEAYFL